MKALIAIAALASFAAVAQDNKPAGPPQPPAELSAEKWFVGSWHCKGTSQPGAMGPNGGPFADTLTGTMDLGGFWLQIHIKADGGPMKGKEMIDSLSSWDGTQHVRYDFMLGGMAKLTSKGFDGDTLVFEGERMMGGQKSTVKHTITRKGESSFESAFEFDGKPAIQETCMRAGGMKKAAAAPAMKAVEPAPAPAAK